MKKPWLIIIVLSLLITACGGNASPQSSSPDGVVLAAMQAISAGDTAKFKALAVENYPSTSPSGDIVYCEGIDTSKLKFEVLEGPDSSMRNVKIFLGTLQLGIIVVQRIGDRWYIHSVNTSGVHCPKSAIDVTPTTAGPFETLVAATPESTIASPATSSIIKALVPFSGVKGQIYFQLGSFDWAVIRTDTHDIINLGKINSGALSPDFTRMITFTRTITGSVNFYLANIDGSQKIKIDLASNDLNHTGFIWSADGKRLAVGVPQGKQASNLFLAYAVFLVNADGSLTQIPNTLDEQIMNFGLELSPDGSKLAFMSFSNKSFVFSMINIDGTGLKRLASSTSTGGGSCDAFVWSPDNRRIAYTSLSDSSCDLIVINTDDLGLTKIAHIEGAFLLDPVWSPDGQKIAFHTQSKANGADQTLFVINSDGSGLIKVPKIGNPIWSPDSKQIAYTANVDRAQSSSPEIFVMNADGSGQKQLTDFGSLPGNLTSTNFFFPSNLMTWLP